jgi:citrate synthase
MARETLSVTDNRTGKQYELPISRGAIPAADLRQIRTSADDFGLMSYDPAFSNTASCESRITFIDGERGILRYRGYPIEQLAEKCCYLEVAYLLLHGELPSRSQLEGWSARIARHTMLHENTKKLMEGFHHDAHPMGMLVSTVAALSTFYPDAKEIHDAESRRLQTCRLIGKMPTIAAYTYRHALGLPYVYPDGELSYAGNLLSMIFKMAAREYRPNPVLERALDILFTLHADHEQNCSTSAMRGVGSAHADPYVCTAAAAAAVHT